jgi:hypothetical protein
VRQRAQLRAELGQQARVVGLRRPQRRHQPLATGAGGGVVQACEEVDRRDEPGEQRVRVRPQFQAGRAARVRVERSGRQPFQQVGVAEHQRTHRRTTPGLRGQHEHVGAERVQVEREERGRGGGVDHDERADALGELGDRRHVRPGPDGSGRRGDGHRLRAGVHQVLVLPRRQLARLDVDLGPACDRPDALRGVLPRRDVGLFVEARNHHFVAQRPALRHQVDKSTQQHGRARPEHDPGRIGTDEIGHRTPGRGDDALRALGRRERATRSGNRGAHRRRHGRGHLFGYQHAGWAVEVDPAVTQRGEQPTNSSDVERHGQHRTDG